MNLRRSQHDMLDRAVAMCCRLYNAALEERVGNWRHGLALAGRRGLASPHDLPKGLWSPVTLHTQFAALTQVRADDPDGYAAIPANMAREVLVRLDLAFKRFFDRVKSGKGKPGFPRFKSVKRWRSVGWDEMNGVRLKGDTIRFKAFGAERGLRFLRHRDWPPGARPCAVRLVRKVGRWEAHVQVSFPVKGEFVASKPASVDKRLAEGLDSEIQALWLKEARAVVRRHTDRETERLAVSYEADRREGFFAALGRDEVRGWDANIANHMTDDLGFVFPNPRIGVEHRRRRSKVELLVARSRRGSKRRVHAVMRLRRLREREANARRTLAHQQSAAVVKASVFNVFEALQIQNMTASAAGTVEEPGVNVAAKAALNREFLDCGHGTRLTYVRYKAERAGGWTVTVPPHGTSVTCSACGAGAKPDADRMFRCVSCGLEMDRDRNAARNVLHRSRGVVAPCASARKDQREAWPKAARISN